MAFARPLRIGAWLALILIAGVIVDGAVCLGCPSDLLAPAVSNSHEGDEGGMEADCCLCLCRVLQDSAPQHATVLLPATTPQHYTHPYRLLLTSSLEHPPQRAAVSGAPCNL